MPTILGLESPEPAKFTEFPSPLKAAAGKVLKLTAVSASKPGHSTVFWLQVYRGTGGFSGLNLWWSQDEAWEAVKVGGVEEGRIPKELVPATAFNYRP
jgi:hypothetical protein